LCEVAAKMGFDPLVAENWEMLPESRLKEVVKSISKYFNGSSKLVIVDAFGELRFSREWLKSVSEKTAELMPKKTGEAAFVSRKRSGYWKKRETRRNHLCEVAAKMGFDPLVAKNWEMLEHAELKAITTSMAYHFNGSSKLAIVDAFPGLDFSKQWLQGTKEKPAEHITT